MLTDINGLSFKKKLSEIVPFRKGCTSFPPFSLAINRLNCNNRMIDVVLVHVFFTLDNARFFTSRKPGF
jgi:hypothetical protein